VPGHQHVPVDPDVGVREPRFEERGFAAALNQSLIAVFT
jgi:hypothetical protein